MTTITFDQLHFVQELKGKHQNNHRGSGGKESNNFQRAMHLNSFPPVDNKNVSTELNPTKGFNSVLTLKAANFLY